MMDVTLGILAHVDAGKTTLSEQLLWRCGVLRRAGRVDNGDTLLDFDPIERERGITVFSSQAELRRGDRVYHLLDTPGHADFSPEMERALSVLDCAVLIVSASDGVQTHTETIWELLKEKNLPVMLFINKMDCHGADALKTLGELRSKLSNNMYLVDDKFDKKALEAVAAADEASLEAYLNGVLSGEKLTLAARKAFSNREFFPVYTGSALKGDGIDRLLEGLDMFSETHYNSDAPFSGRAYKVAHDGKGLRTVFFKVLSGTVHAKDTIGDEKIDELRIYNGDRAMTVKEATAGSLVGAAGLSKVKCGDGLGGVKERPSQTFAPLLTAGVVFDKNIPAQKVIDALRTLEDEEPCVKVLIGGGSINVAVMGEIELEVLSEELSRRFGLAVGFGERSVLYKETIKHPVRGYGHYEPLRHYAEVHLLIEPAPRGSGVTFTSTCKTDDLDKHWQNLIGTHVLEKEHAGALSGFPLTDVKVTLLSGKAHIKHTEGGDFREATYRAIRQGLFKAESVILEPIYDFEASVPQNLGGRVISDVQRMSGSTQPPESDGNTAMIRGRCPVSEMAGYVREFAAFTRGGGRLKLRFDGYDVCHNAETVVESADYDREADTENSPDSVFCSHGAGYGVRWDRAESLMHLPL